MKQDALSFVPFSFCRKTVLDLPPRLSDKNKNEDKPQQLERAIITETAKLWARPARTPNRRKKGKGLSLVFSFRMIIFGCVRAPSSLDWSIFTASRA